MGVAQGNDKQSRMGLAEKLNASGAHRILGKKISNKKRAEAGSQALFLEDAWMMVLQCLCFTKDGILGEVWMGEDSGHSLSLSWPGRG